MKINLPQPPSYLGWHGRGYLPHFDGGELAQFITFRLHDSLPRDLLIRWKEELKLEENELAQSLMRRRVEAYLDQGHGNCYLSNPAVARLVQDAMLFHDQSKYRLIAWVVMPNHAHILCMPSATNSLAGIMHSLKSFTSKEANKVLTAREDSGRKSILIDTSATRDSSQRQLPISKTIR